MNSQPSMEWRDIVRREYQDAVRSLQGTSGVQRQEAFLLAQGRLAELVEVGELRIDPIEAIRHELYRADDEQGKLADGLIHTLVTGQDALDFDRDPLADTVVVLGNGVRKTWASVDATDLHEMDALRYKNFHAAADAYDRWRRDFEALIGALIGYQTVGEAMAGGAFDHSSGQVA